VNITNSSGATYRDARLKLMAGDVQIERPRRKGFGRDRAVAVAMAEGVSSFEEQPFYEYHLYTLQRPSTVADKQVKQLSLFPTATTPVKKEYRVTSDEGKVKVTLEFENRERVGLGIPLPKGKVRVYKESPDGGLEFVGEDRIDHTPKDEKVRVSTGQAFDVTVEKTLTDSKDLGRSGREETWVYKLRNHKKDGIEVVVEAQFGMWRNWKLLDGTTPGWAKKDAASVEWRVKLKPDEEREVTYIVRFE